MYTQMRIVGLVGAVLGIIAFFKTMLDPVLDANKRRWEEIKKRLDEVHFQNLEFEVWHTRRIDIETLRPIERFVADIKECPEYLRFGPLLRKQYSTHLNNLRKHYLKFREYVQTPYWEPSGDVETTDVQDLRLNKSAFSFGEHKTGNDYSVNLERAAEQAEKMRVEFRALSVLSNLHLFEVPFSKQIVQRRAALPNQTRDLLSGEHAAN